MSPRTGDATPVAHAAYAARPTSRQQRVPRESPAVQPVTVRFGDRDNFVGIDPARPGQTGPTFRLHAAATGEPGIRITADIPQHAPGPGNILVKNYGENTGISPGAHTIRRVHPRKEKF